MHYVDMEHVIFEHARGEHIGLPEAVFCEGKPPEVVARVISENRKGSLLLFTCLTSSVLASFEASIREVVDYHPLSRPAFRIPFPVRPEGLVAVVSVGAADGPVAWETARILAELGVRHHVYEDCGVAGLWRLRRRLEEISAHDTSIVVAGLDAAFAPVLGGLSPRPLFSVPTSVGYGMAAGKAALTSTLVHECALVYGSRIFPNAPYGSA